MISPVMMKGNKAGIRLIISPDATISQVVTCLSDNKGIRIGRRPRSIEKPKKKSIYSDKNGLFYIGNLKNGQSIQAAASIVIVGDVESGASVESEGNIIIIGALHGAATSGCKGKPDTFVYSLK